MVMLWKTFKNDIEQYIGVKDEDQIYVIDVEFSPKYMKSPIKVKKTLGGKWWIKQIREKEAW